MALATALLSKTASASNASDMNGSNSMEQAISNSNKGHYIPSFKFGMGGVPLGNEFAVVTDKDAYAAIEAAWNAGVRYYDMAPWYGLGLAERRYGNFLHNKNRSEYIVSP
jgi:D-threo-aldose 1-dehydrogenase